MITKIKYSVIGFFAILGTAFFDLEILHERLGKKLEMEGSMIRLQRVRQTMLE